MDSLIVYNYYSYANIIQAVIDITQHKKSDLWNSKPIKSFIRLPLLDTKARGSLGSVSYIQND